MIIMEKNILDDYCKALEYCREKGQTDSFMITLKQLYNLAQFNAVSCLNESQQQYFQILALLCKRTLKTNEGLETLQNHLQLFANSIEHSQ